MSSFIYNGRLYQLEGDHGERAIEVPIVYDIIKDIPDADILEIGNVLRGWVKGYGRIMNHTVVDKYDKGGGIIQSDIVNYIPSNLFKFVICISTLEHVGNDSPELYDENKTLAAFDVMKKCLVVDGVLIVTWPLGYNKNLDTHFDVGKLDFTYVDYMKLVDRQRRWYQCEYKDIRGSKYNFPYPAGNGLIIGYYVNYEVH